MKKIAAIVFVMIFGALTLGACGDPCEKAFDKVKSCALKELPKDKHDEYKKDMDKMKKTFLTECKKSKSKVKACNKHDDCKKFDECMEKIK